MSVVDRFKGSAKAEVKTGRTPNPNLGKAAYLISQVRMKESTKPGASGFRVEIAMNTLWDIEAGKTAAGEVSPCNVAGDKVSDCIFSGDYFLKSFKDFCLKAVGKEPHEELEIADLICPESEHPNMSELDRLTLMWDSILPGLVCAFDPNNEGKATEAGCFDGQIAIELGTTEKAVPQLIDKAKGAVDGNFMFDGNGQKIEKVYRNSYYNRKISMKEVGETLDEAGIKKFFGSTENFMKILENEG